MKKEARPAFFLALAVAIAAAYRIGFLKYLDYRYTQNVASLDIAHGNKLDIQGRHLSEAIDNYWHGAPNRETGKNKDLAAIALNWIPKGTSFVEAEIILEAADFYPAGDRSTEGEVWYSVRQVSWGNSGVSIWLKPIAPGDFRQAGEIEAAIWVNSL